MDSCGTNNVMKATFHTGVKGLGPILEHMMVKKPLFMVGAVAASVVAPKNDELKCSSKRSWE